MDNTGESNDVGANTPPSNTTNTTDITPEGEVTALHSGEEQVIAYERKLNTLQNEVATLVRDRTLLAEEIERESLAIAQFMGMLTPILQKEQSVVELLKDASIKERGTQDIQQRRIYEQERWKHIEEWYTVEQEKWNIQEKLDEQKKRTDEHRKQHVFFLEKESALTIEIEKILIEEEKAKLHLALSEVTANRVDIEGKLYTLEEMREKAFAQFNTICQTEEGIEKKETEVEGMLLSAHSLTEERSLSQERYALEKERHEVESSRWNVEDEMAQLGGSVVESEKLLNELKQKEAELTAKLDALPQQVCLPSTVLEASEAGVS